MIFGDLIADHADMAGKPRIHFPGAVYHAMLRGNDGEDIFYSDADRSRFYNLLEEGREHYVFRVHAFCLAETYNLMRPKQTHRLPCRGRRLCMQLDPQGLDYFYYCGKLRIAFSRKCPVKTFARKSRITGNLGHSTRAQYPRVRRQSERGRLVRGVPEPKLAG